MYSKDVNHLLKIMAREFVLRECIKKERAIVLGQTEDERPLLLSKEKLKTHLFIQAPTQHGNSFLARHIVRDLLTERGRNGVFR